MANYLAYGGVRFPSQGSSEVTERVKHFNSSVSFDDLQTQINVFLLFLSTPVILNRPAIRNITFNVFEKLENPDKGQFQYFAQVHYILLGDADDTPNL